MNDKKINILVIPSSYPSAANPGGGIFVKQLIEKFRKLNTDITVIAPQPYHIKLNNFLCSAPESDVLEPGYLSLSNKMIGTFSTYKFTENNFNKAASNAGRKLSEKPDLVYGHFLFPGGRAALETARHLNIPSVAALGEGNLEYYESHLGIDFMKSTTDQLSGILTVSQENKDYCINKLGIKEDKILFKPNSADTEKFFPNDKTACRSKFNLPKEKKIIIFAGHFNHNKGADRVVKALEKLDNIYGVFLGSGEPLPNSDKILFSGKVSHAEMPEWLSAADAFVLPTIREASSNAVAEAAACGLPVVTSDIPSMHDMLTNNFAEFVNPESIEGIAEGISKTLSDNNKLENMSKAALEHYSSYSLETRASDILDWLGSIIDNYKNQ
ncbi:MAG: glycosyltransferase family 4 protein [Planctomycetota bacterium]|jgi:glycosyltransferase involved in cell wall biosynthesis